MNPVTELNRILAQYAPVLAGKVPIAMVDLPKDDPCYAHFTATLPNRHGSAAGLIPISISIELDRRFWTRANTRTKINMIRHEAAHVLEWYTWVTGPQSVPYPTNEHGRNWRAWARRLNVDTSEGIGPT
jgi:hypothetical protein